MKMSSIIRNPMRPFMGLPDDSIWDETTLTLISQYGGALSEDEIRELFNITDAVFEDMSEADRERFQYACKVERLRGLHSAATNLFAAMGGKERLQASLAYLVRFGAEWKESGAGGVKLPEFTVVVKRNENQPEQSA